MYKQINITSTYYYIVFAGDFRQSKLVRISMNCLTHPGDPSFIHFSILYYVSEICTHIALIKSLTVSVLTGYYHYHLTTTIC